MKKIVSLCLVIAVITSLCSCTKKENPEIEQIKTICELSTIKAYYNNVAKSTKEAGKSWWKVLEKDREFWIEYDGVAEIGIDMDKVTMQTEGDIVYVTMPDAELLNTRIVRETFDESCYITSADSWWDHNKITTEDQQGAINKAQAEMCKRVQENKALFERAERIAKDTIQNYFDKLNNITGTNFKLEWK